MAYRIVIALYGLINIAGGVIGFVAAKSPGSLTVGLATGFMLLYCAYVAGAKPGLAYRLAAAIAAGLVAFWCYRIYEVTQQGKPTTMAVMNLVLGAVVFITLGAGHMLSVRKRGQTES